MDTSDGAAADRVPGGVEPTTKLLVKEVGGGEREELSEKFLAIGDSIPSNTLSAASALYDMLRYAS